MNILLKKLVQIIKVKPVRSKQDNPLLSIHLIKQSVIEKEKAKSGYNILIETGTYLGDMVEAQKKFFDKVYSIELGEELYFNAVKKFENDSNVKILHGDSGIVLHELMLEINEPAIFWLDGHYSEGITAQGIKDCPILEELTAIFNSKKLKHRILIDDARLFNGANDYPTIDALKEFLKTKNPVFNFTIKHDIIIIEQ